MNSFKFQTLSSVALISFVMGCILMCMLMKGCQKEKTNTTLSTKIVRHEHDKNKAAFRDTIGLLTDQAKYLTDKIKLQKNKIAATKKLYKSPITATNPTILKIGYRASDLLKRAKKESVNIINDSKSIENDIDKKTENIYIELVNVQDSLLQVKDAVINTLSNQVEQQNLLIEKILKEQEQLVTENIKLKKQLKTSKRRGRLLAIITGIIGGLATHQLTK
jgi:hypothetical protein